MQSKGMQNRGRIWSAMLAITIAVLRVAVCAAVDPWTEFSDTSQAIEFSDDWEQPPAEFRAPWSIKAFDKLDGANSSIQFLDPYAQVEQTTLWDRVSGDYRNFYGRESLTLLGMGFGVGGVMANTNIDRSLQESFQSSVRGADSDDWFEFLHANKEMGNPKYTVSVLASAYLAGQLLDQWQPANRAGLWGERSIRGYLVGVPPVIALQSITGASRPGEVNYESDWRPFADDNGVSGHSFISSLPFITAAKMTDRPLLKTGLYFGSVLGPLSRVNDNAHYPSQAFLGWWVAYLAASAVDQTESKSNRLRFYSYVTADSSGLATEFRW